MRSILLFLFVFLCLCITVKMTDFKKEPEHKIIPENKIEKKQEETYDEPNWIKYPPLKPFVLKNGKVLSDIRCHINDNGYYNDSDLVTAGHETTHGINSDIRNKNYSGVPINGFYCLEDRGIIINEPKVHIKVIASEVPKSLRGSVYKLYLVDQAASGWDDRALYLLDEWTSYTNGSEVRKDLGMEKRAETVRYMLEFSVYVMTLTKVVAEKEPSYDAKKLKDFVRWNVERSMKIYNNEQEATEYLEKFRNNEDAQSLREFLKVYFGVEWCKKILGI